jgi:hypothetical protein
MRRGLVLPRHRFHAGVNLLAKLRVNDKHHPSFDYGNRSPEDMLDVHLAASQRSHGSVLKLGTDLQFHGECQLRNRPPAIPISPRHSSWRISRNLPDFIPTMEEKPVVVSEFGRDGRH